MQLFGSKLERIICSVLYTIQTTQKKQFVNIQTFRIQMFSDSTFQLSISKITADTIKERRFYFGFFLLVCKQQNSRIRNHFGYYEPSLILVIFKFSLFSKESKTGNGSENSERLGGQYLKPLKMLQKLPKYCKKNCPLSAQYRKPQCHPMHTY